MNVAVKKIRIACVAGLMANCLTLPAFAQSLCDPLQRIFADSDNNFKNIKGQKPARGNASGTVPISGYTCEVNDYPEWEYICYSGRKTKSEAQTLALSNWNAAKSCFPNAVKSYTTKQKDGRLQYWIELKGDWNFIFVGQQKNGGWVSEITLENFDLG